VKSKRESGERKTISPKIAEKKKLMHRKRGSSQQTKQRKRAITYKNQGEERKSFWSIRGKKKKTKVKKSRCFILGEKMAGSQRDFCARTRADGLESETDEAFPGKEIHSRTDLIKRGAS